MPEPTWLVTPIVPPSCSTIFREIANPRPSPRRFVVLKSSKIACRRSGGIPRHAALAAAHKARFPSLRLVGGPSRTSQELSDFLDGSAIAWSLLASLTQPIYQGGRLKASEERARQRVVQAEKQYLDLVYQAFAEVENAISRDVSLQGRYDAIARAEGAAAAAYELSFEQYQRGLVSYATVLESQRRAFDSQTTLIDLSNQLLQNRITLYTALGGEFGQVDELALQ